jgi:general secretion pathway protein F
VVGAVPQFAYRALTEAGEKVVGEIEAGDEKGAIVRLQAQGLIPIEAVPSASAVPGLVRGGRASSSGGRHAQALTLATRELATLLEAGETLESALALVAAEVDDRRLGQTLGGVLDRVRGGAALSESMAAEPTLFSRPYVGMVRAAEATGRLGPVLAELAELRERQATLRRQLTSALVYPIILMLTAVGAIVVLLLYVVPQFEPVFAGAEDRLPAATLAILDTASWLRQHGPLLGLVVGGTLLAAIVALQLPSLRLGVDRLLLRLPGGSALVRERATAEIARGLATLLKGGLDLPSALAMLREMVSNLAVGEALGRAAAEVRQGRRLAEALGAEGVLQPMGEKLLKTAEESGRLEPLSRYIAERFEERMATRMQRFVTLLEPILVIGLGGIVGGIVIAILTAVLSVNELAF